MHYPKSYPNTSSESESVAASFSEISLEEPIAVFDHTSIGAQTFSVPVETPTSYTMALTSRLTCVMPVPITPDQINIQYLQKQLGCLWPLDYILRVTFW